VSVERRRVAWFVKVDGCDPVRLTESMRRGLRVVLHGEDRARRSNTTDSRRGLVYWQAADQLIAAGLVVPSATERDRLLVTPFGWRGGYELDADAPQEQLPL